jgi:MFS family permease
MFLMNIFWKISWACQTYVVFLRRDALGLSLKQIGFVTAAAMAASAALSYPAGMLADRFHPMRAMLWIRCALVAIVPLDFVWVIWNHLPTTTNYHIVMLLWGIQLPLGAVFDIANMPSAMRILPNSRYGQFASFDSTVMAICSIGATLAGAFFMTEMRRLFPDAVWGANYCYRLMPVWRLPFLGIALVFLFLMYGQWKRLGGAESYKVPGFEN